MNRKIIAAIIMSSCLLGSALASDNRTAPNVFSSGSTISSSKMNENFNFLASEMREKSVYCDNGETISDAINAGYNSLTIYGSCSGEVGVSRMDPSPFGISYSDMPNKPISNLIITGGSSNGTDKITTPSGGFDFFIDDAYLQLSNLELVLGEKFYSGGGYVRFMDITISGGGITFARTTSGEIKNTTFNGEVSIRENSHITFNDSTLNSSLNLYRSGSAWLNNTAVTGGSNNSEALLLSMNSTIELSGTSVITHSREYSSVVTLTNNSSLNMNESSKLEAGSNVMPLNISRDSSAILSGNTMINSVDETAIRISRNSTLLINSNASVTSVPDKNDIYVDATSSLEIDGDSTSIGDVGCEGITSVVENNGNTSVSIGSSCNGYQNLMPNFIKITSGNCESNGHNNLLSPHECSQASGGMVSSVSGVANYINITGCYYNPNTTGSGQPARWYFNSDVSQETLGNEFEAWCRQ